MVLNSIKLINFRNYEKLNVSFTSGLNVICGKNASGKTNLVEAIHYLSLARSFRLVSDFDLIKRGCEFATIDAEVDDENIKKQIRIVITKDGKKVSVNNKGVLRLSDLSSLTNVLVFEPKDVMLFRDSPRVRRTFLDVNLSKRSSTYFECISRYDKILKERNELLKQFNPDLEHLKIITNTLIATSVPIVRLRELYVGELSKVIEKVFEELDGRKRNIAIKYYPYLPSSSDFENKAKEIYDRNLDGDLKKKTTSAGCHREDFFVELDGKEIGSYGSQGENRIMALALKLAPYFLVEEDKKPIVVLDDAL